MATVKVILTKSFPWRNGAEEWSNGYHLVVPAIPDRAGFGAIIDAIWASVEAPIIGNPNNLVSALAYADPAGKSTESFAWPPDGQPGQKKATGSAIPTPLVGYQAELCFLAKANCGRTAAGKPRYLTKYYHPLVGPAGDSTSGIRAAINAPLTKLIDGTLPQGAKWCAPDGLAATGISIDPFVRVHQLKRRGKRP